MTGFHLGLKEVKISFILTTAIAPCCKIRSYIIRPWKFQLQFLIHSSTLNRQLEKRTNPPIGFIATRCHRHHIATGVSTFRPVQFQPFPFQPLSISTYTIFCLWVLISSIIILGCFHFHSLLNSKKLFLGQL